MSEAIKLMVAKRLAEAKARFLEVNRELRAAGGRGDWTWTHDRIEAAVYEERLIARLEKQLVAA